MVREVDAMMLALAAPPAHVATLTLQDLRRTVSLAAPQISPDGKRIAVLVRRNDYEKDRTTTDLVLVDVTTRAARVLAGGQAISRVAWSPDGSQIAYIAAAGEKDPPQIFVLRMDGGAPVQLTHEKNGISDFNWSPDGRALAYSSSPDPANESAIDRHEDAFNVTDDAWTQQAAPTPERLYEIASSGGRARQIGAASLEVGGGFTYAPDGHSIFVTEISAKAHKNRYLSRRIVRISLKSNDAVPLAALSVMQTDPMRSDRAIAFAFANPRGTMQTELALAGTDGSSPHQITQHLDRNVTGGAFLPNGDLLAVANDGAQRRLFTVTQSGAVHAVALGNLSASDLPSVSRTGAIAFIGVAPDHPAELYIIQRGTLLPERLTNYNGWIARYRLGETRPITWRTFDGLTADGVLTYPAGWHAGVRAPLVLYIHGGPTSASTVAYSGFVQVLAAHGWFVFQPNYRGSDNLGLRYAKTTVPHITSVPGRDIEAGLAQVLRTVPIDTQRVGVSGWSEGGLLTSWLITQDRRWRAAVSGAAVNDWVQYDAMSDSKDFSPQFIGKSPWTSEQRYALYEAESPLTYASNVRTPTLIMSDAGDYRVPTPLAYEFYHEVRATGTPVQFVIYPVVGHFPRDPVRIEDVFRRWNEWLVKYL
jgi:dipeptidyl aminopeptidase/acylaminoacyl peptidase